MVSNEGDNLRQAVFGANDGLVSTFGLVAGLIGANAPQAVLIVANVVNMFAAGMSMGLGSYISTKSQVEYAKRIVMNERTNIRTNRAAALKELRALYRKRGVPERELKRHMDTVTDNEKEWVEFVVEEKYGLGAASFPNPIKGGLIMFFVFVMCGFVPIAPLFFTSGFDALAFSAILTASALFFVGALKQQLTGKSWLWLGVENLMLGAITGTVGFLAGLYTSGLVGGLALG